jgi:hypothetical protein
MLPREALTKRTSSINRKIRTLGLTKKDLRRLEAQLPIPVGAKMFVSLGEIAARSETSLAPEQL